MSALQNLLVTVRIKPTSTQSPVGPKTRVLLPLLYTWVTWEPKGSTFNSTSGYKVQPGPGNGGPDEVPPSCPLPRPHSLYPRFHTAPHAPSTTQAQTFAPACPLSPDVLGACALKEASLPPTMKELPAPEPLPGLSRWAQQSSHLTVGTEMCVPTGLSLHVGRVSPLVPSPRPSRARSPYVFGE